MTDGVNFMTAGYRPLNATVNIYSFAIERPLLGLFGSMDSKGILTGLGVLTFYADKCSVSFVEPTQET